jgi:hypothetical protein
VSRSVIGLLLILLVQCVIVAVIIWPVETAQEGAAKQTLTPFSINEVDELHIGDKFDNEAVLVKSGNQWLIRNLKNLPADTARVDALLRGLTAGEGGWPIAHSQSARQRFQVASHYYQRRLTLLSAGEKLGTLYLGTSPGFRNVHARNASQDAIYSITLSNFETPAVSGSWLDPRLLQIRAPLRVDADLYSLHFKNSLWLSGSGGTPNEGELEALISTLKAIQVEGVAAGDTQRDLAAREADLVLEIQSLAGDMTLELSSLKGEYFIHSSEYPLFFKLNAHDFDRLEGIDVGLISGEKSGQ